jgi:hypothetical protein
MEGFQWFQKTFTLEVNRQRHAILCRMKMDWTEKKGTI